MPSPFPGMDPYLEDPKLWPDLHHRLITYTADELQKQIRPHYRARIEERLYVVQSGRNIYPDVTVLEQTIREQTLAEADAVTMENPPPVDTPLTIVLTDDEIREPFIEIIHAGDEQVVTVIEILSPANKSAGPGRELYLTKQQEVLDSPAHLVELDLLSQGEHTIALPAAKLQNLPAHRYKISVGYGPEHLKFDLYLTRLSQRLPRFRIPLKSPDASAIIDLPAIFNQAYENGGYADFVDYNQPPPVPLSKEEQVWWKNERISE